MIRFKSWTSYIAGQIDGHHFAIYVFGIRIFYWTDGIK